MKEFWVMIRNVLLAITAGWPLLGLAAEQERADPSYRISGVGNDWRSSRRTPPPASPTRAGSMTGTANCRRWMRAGGWSSRT